jgi:hypothetical protein
MLQVAASSNKFLQHVQRKLFFDNDERVKQLQDGIQLAMRQHVEQKFQ